MLSLEAFLGSLESHTSGIATSYSRLSVDRPPDLPESPTYSLKPPLPIGGRAILLRHSIGQTITIKYRNINLLSIHYAFRPHVRSRLTLGGVTWPRNPWIFGGGDSRPPFATHFSISSCDTSSAPCRYTFVSIHNTLLPYLSIPIASACRFSPVTFSAQDH